MQAVADHIAQQSHIGQVDRLLQRLLHGDDAAVVFLAEVAEPLHPTAGEELLIRGSGIAALQGGIKHLRQRGFRVQAQVFQRPQSQRIPPAVPGVPPGVIIGTGQLPMQLGDDFQITGQHPQLGGGAQLQFAAGVEIKGEPGGVGLHPHLVPRRGALHQGETVADLGGLLRRQQALAQQPCLRGGQFIRQRFEKTPYRALQLHIQRALDLEIQPVQIVGRLAEQRHQLIAGDPGGLVHRGRLQQRVLLPVPVAHVGGQCHPRQLAVDPLVVVQQSQMAVDQFAQLVPPAQQIPARPPLGDDQRQRLTQRHRLCRDAPLAIEIGREVIDIRSKPDPQRIPHAMHLAMPGRCSQGHGIEVVAHQLLAGRHGFRAVHIGSHCGRSHLPQLVGGRVGPALQRMTVFLHLGGQGTGAMAGALAAQRAGHQRHRRPDQARPVHRRVGPRQARVQQVAVLDEQQGLDQQRGNIRERVEAKARIIVCVDQLTVGVGDLQPGVGLLFVGQKQAVAGVLQQVVGEARLAGDFKSMAIQPGLELRQLAVAQPLVERACIRKMDSIALPITKLVMEPIGVLAEPIGLEPGITELEPGQTDQNQREKAQ